MTYDLYFHDDFDGRASAALMLLFLEGRGDHIGHFVPVDHDIQSQWLDDRFFNKHHLFRGTRNAPIVLDFPFHSGTAFWFDHHPTAFKKEVWRKGFRADVRHVCNPSYFSCCHLVYDMLQRNFKWHPPSHLRTLVKWLDIIDTARYTSAKQAILMKEPAFAVDSFIDAKGSGPKKAEWLIQQFATKSLEDIAKIRWIAAAGKRARRDALRDLPFYRKHLVIEGNVSFIDLTKHPDRFLRHAPYYLLPKVRYGMRVMKKGSLYNLGVGENPWTTGKGRIHLGNLLKKYGGGGHNTAAAVRFGTKRDMERAKEEIVGILNTNRK